MNIVNDSQFTSILMTVVSTYNCYGLVKQVQFLVGAITHDHEARRLVISGLSTVADTLALPKSQP